MANAAEWMHRVSQWRRSGLTAAEFSRGREFAASTLRWWSSRLNAMEPPKPLPATAMIQVRRQPAPIAPEVLVEIEDALVRVPVGASQETLAAVFAALRAGAAR